MPDRRKVYPISFICFISALYLIIIFPSFSKEKPKEKRLNVLLITIDTLRADRLSCYGGLNPRTPNIDSLAGKGILFSKAFAPSPLTLPSHANILLGVTPLHHRVHDNSNFIVAGEFLTLAEHLKDFGYSTAAVIGAYPLDSRFGLNQGFDVYDDEYGSQDFQEITYVERKAEAVVENSLRWLMSRKNPWFLWVHCFDPHVPYQPPEPFKSRYENRPYEGEVAYVDYALGKLFDYLKDKNLFDRTVIIFTSDHGESLGEHGENTHGYFAYNSTIWVPLIFCVPGMKPGQIDQYVSHIDIFPTLCDVLEVHKPGFLQGISLLPAIRGKTLPGRPIYFESMYPFYSRGWAPLTGFISRSKKFIDSPLPELYDLNADFNETHNLASQQNLDDFRTQLRGIARSFSLPEKGAREQKIDRESREKLESLGYISSAQAARKEKFGPEDDIKTLLPFDNRAAEAFDLYNNNRGRVQEAVEALKNIMAERKDIDISYTNLAAIYKGEGRFSESLEILEQGLRQLPSSYEIFLTYVNYLLSAGRYDDVIKIFNEKNLSQREHDPEIWNCLGVAYASKKDLAKAISAYEKAISLDKDFPAVFNNLGTLYFLVFVSARNAEAYEKSAQNFNKAIKLDPAYAAAYNGMGALYREAGNLDDAISCWEKAVELRPDFGNALYNLGLAYLDKGDKAKSLNYLNKYKEHFYSSLSPEERRKLDGLIQKCK